ncbi:MAG: hypothetical protein AAF634_15760 [Bacteroidota bacterium]
MKEGVIESVQTTTTELVSATVGAMASRVVAPHIPGGPAGKIGASLIVGILAGKAKAKSGMEKNLKAVALGASVVQFTEGVIALVQPTVAKMTEGKTGVLYDGLRKSVGLAAPDSSYYEEIVARGFTPDTFDLPAPAPIAGPAGA